MSTLSLFAAATDSRVDAENGVLRGVRVISKGEAKGHSYLGEPIIIDDITLDEVVEASASFPDGVPVKLAHGTDIEELVGSIRDIVRDVDCVRGDLYLLKSHENYATIIEMAQTMPSNFGVSISFMNAPEPIKGNDMEPDGDEDDEGGDADILAQLVGDDIVAYAARVCELYSADLVQAPACNPSLFSQPMSDTSATPEVLPEAPVEEVKVEEIPASEIPEETLKQIAAEVGVEASEIESVGVTDASVEVKEELEVKGPEGTQNLPEEKKPEVKKAEKAPAPAELSRVMDAVKNDFETTKTELSRVTTELAAVRTELTAAQENLAIKDAQLVELNMLHRSVLSVMGLGASIEIPEISEEAPSKSILEQYEEMPAGAERLAFFQANRREIERSIAAKLK